jgi:hypothetical protein
MKYAIWQPCVTFRNVLLNLVGVRLLPVLGEGAVYSNPEQGGIVRVLPKGADVTISQILLQTYW